jgi:hypothetical protein
MLIGALTWLWNVLKPVINILRILWNILGQIYEQVAKKVMKAFHDFAKMIKDTVGKVFQWFAGVAKNVSDWFNKTFPGAIKAAMEWIKKFMGVAGPLIDALLKMMGIKINMKAAIGVDDGLIKTSAADKKAKKEANTGFDFGAIGGGTGLGGGTGGGKTVHNHKHTHINTKVSAQTDAKPALIAANIVNAIKFNLPIAMASGSGVLQAGAGSQVGTGAPAQ